MAASRLGEGDDGGAAHDDLAHTGDLTLTLLAARAPEATVCPSEVARALAAVADAGTAMADWRNAMPAVHAAVDQLLAKGLVRLSWKGQPIAARTGPYRIGRPARL